jgi:polyisoprenoid-binding protein YceI
MISTPFQMHSLFRGVVGLLATVALGCGLFNANACSRSPEGTRSEASAAGKDQTSAASPAGAVATNASAIQYLTNTPGGEALVSGTSTLHSWTVKTGDIKGSAQFTGEWKAGPEKAIKLQSIDLSIPVSSLKSTEGSGMDNTMYDALNLKKFPAISYHLTKATLKNPPSGDKTAYRFDTVGQLVISGNTHPVNLDLVVTPAGDGKLTIATEVSFKMSDWGVTPPTAMLGMVKSGDQITVNITWQLTRQAAESRIQK